MSVDEQRLNPFPGLRSFEPEEEHLFFGRETQIDEILTRLRKTRFLTVVGTSGSGKSSIVRSGLIPSLYSGYMVTAGSSWRIAIQRPGDDPIGNLARALNDPEVLGKSEEPDRMAQAILDSTLRRGDRGLIDAVTQSGLPESENLLVVVDQFEELFRFKRSRKSRSPIDESTAFVNLLLRAAEQDERRIYVVLTMRSDFLGSCTEFNGLPEAINNGLYLIPRMLREQRRMAICGPVAVGGADISPRLVLGLLNDVGDDPDQLPIMQHAMMRTWDYWDRNHTPDEPLDLRHYEAIGRMKEALSLHAEEAFAELGSDAARHRAEGIFKNLTEMGQDGRGIRRPTSVDDLCAATNSTVEEVIEIVEVFRQPGRSFLAPPAGAPLTGASVVDISHESLMRVWTRLKGWANEEARSAQLYIRLAEAAALHHEGRAGLWRDPELQAARTWAETTQPTAVWAAKYDPAFERAMIFLRLSKEAREREATQKELMRKRQLERTRRFAIILGSAALIMLFVGLYAFVQKGQADAERLKAEEAKQVAETAQHEAEVAAEEAERERLAAERERLAADRERERAEASERDARQQREVAETNAQEAIRQSRIASEQSRIAQEQREAALEEKARADREADAAVAAKERADANRRMAEESEKRASRLRLLELARSLALQVERVRRAHGPEAAAQVALKAYQLNLDNGGPPQRTEFYDGLRTALAGLDDAAGGEGEIAALDRSFPGHLDAVRAVAVSPENSLLASGDDDGGVHFLDLDDLRPAATRHQQVDSPVRSLAFDPSGSDLVVGTFSGAVYLARPGQPSRRLDPTAPSPVVSLAIAHDGTMAAAASADGSLRLWRGLPAATGAFLDRRLDQPLAAIAFSPDGSRLITGGYEGSLQSWDLRADPPVPRDLAKAPAGVRSIAVSADGTLLAVGTESGVVEIRDLSAGTSLPQLLGHRSSVNDLAFSPDASALVSAGSDGVVNIWDYRDADLPPIALTDHGTWVWSAAYSNDGRFIVSAGADNQVRRWPARTDELAARVCGYVSEPLSTEQWEAIFPPDLEYTTICPSPGGSSGAGGSRP